jgi:Helicase conserved C-terminal domain/SNF2-related domain
MEAPVEKKKPSSAFFKVDLETNNCIKMRRFSRVLVTLVGDKTLRCQECKLLFETLGRYECVTSLNWTQPPVKKDCHSSLAVACVGSGESLVFKKLPCAPARVVATLNELFLVRKVFRPLKHQRALMDRYDIEGGIPAGILIAFALGSGKTHSALALLDSAGVNQVDVVAGVSLLSQWRDSILQHAPPLGTRTPVTGYILRGYQKFEADVYENSAVLKGRSVIVDEAHYFKNMTATMEPSIEALLRSDHVLALTGTPLRNDVRDIDFVLRLVGRGELVEPRTLEEETLGGSTLHWSAYVDAEPPNPYASQTKLRQLLEGLHGRVAQYNPKYCETETKYHQRYPTTTETTVFHDLTWEQVVELAFYGQGVTVRVKGKNVSIGATGGTLRRLSIMNAVPDLENTGTIYSSKADSLVREIEAVGGFPQVAFSHFRANLLEPLAQRLREHFHVRVEELSGSTPVPDREKILKAYNAGKVQVLLICRVGGQGLDLTAPTRALHLMEPQNNCSEEEQVIGRVVRYSQAVIDSEQRQPVKIVRHVCRNPRRPPSAKEKAYMVAIVNADIRLVRAFTGKSVLLAEFESQDGPHVPFNPIMKYVQGILDLEGGRSEEERMVASNNRKRRRIFPLEVVLWMASGSDAKGKGVPKYWSEEFMKIMDPERASHLEKNREKRNLQKQSKKARLLQKPSGEHSPH